MKTNSVHSCLTMPQRLRAMILAHVRWDQEEFDRLAASSSDGCYTVWKVRHQFVCLSHLAALHNGLLLEPCAVWLMGQTFSPEETRNLSAAEIKALQVSRNESLAEAASVEAAFTGRLSSAGISSPDWKIFRERLLVSPRNTCLRHS